MKIWFWTGLFREELARQKWLFYWIWTFSPSKTIELRFVLLLLLLLLSVTNCCTLIKIKHDQCWTGSDTIRVSQICDGKWPAEGGFSVTNLGNSDRVQVSRCPGVQVARWPGGLLRVDFPWRIWETLIVSDPVQLWWMAFSKAPLAPSIPFTDQLHNVIGGAVSSLPHTGRQGFATYLVGFKEG